MAFNKVVKAPAKLAHIRNCPRKKSEREKRRMEWLLESIKNTTTSLLAPFGQEYKMYLYTRLREDIAELNSLTCYNGVEAQAAITEIKFYHDRML
ncbi:hypothetical protein BIS47_179 [Klebsiella phage vB_KpnM_BIS47]|uniref:Uncharacterized protein n=1 Tax=Klebsiella phage vB_KpnM_BIS47 TaxID=1907784 RepID=A0A1V0E757_9CAUD|nr:hypothetical protein BIS47_179 [Klebsiella phage vB_KpnM_BIS47]ARB12683.1 hypothetical protein BIS47_179 [Klebsiella phage vB_KpnM_BIS47]